MIKVLDHGFVRLVESYGVGDADVAEAGIIEAARQSTQGAFRGWEQDAKLLRFLYEHKHSTPFEFAGMVIEVRAPIMVFREWHRHRTQAYNEMSARYAPLPDQYYLPTVERYMMGKQSTTNKQGSEGGLSLAVAERAQDIQRNSNLVSRRYYELLMELGVAKELARGPLNVFQYSQMRAVTSLRNWLGFLTLRMDPAAQYEIRMFANAVGAIIAQQFPRTWSLYCE